MESLVLHAQEWLLLVLLGGIFGALGQVLRVIAGFKKLGDKLPDNTARHIATDPLRLRISLLLGFAAGAVAALGLAVAGDGASGFDTSKVSGSHILGLMAAGYAGSDFIEAFMGKWVHRTTVTGVSEAARTVVPPTAGNATGTTTGTAASHASHASQTRTATAPTANAASSTDAVG